MFALIIIVALALTALLAACFLSLRSGVAELEARARTQREYARQDRIAATYGVKAPALGSRR